MNEARLTTIEQIEQFLNASTSIAFSAAADDSERYAHISRVLKRFDYTGRNKRERGLLRRYPHAILSLASSLGRVKRSVRAMRPVCANTGALRKTPDHSDSPCPDSDSKRSLLRYPCELYALAFP